MTRRGAAERGDEGVVVRVGVVWVVHCCVVHCCVVAIVFWWSSGDADFRFTNISRTRGLKLARMILLRGPVDAIVVIDAFIATNYGGIGRRLSKSDLPLVAHLRGLGVAQNFRAFQCAVAHEAYGSRAGGIIYLFARRRYIDGKFRTAWHMLGSLGASSTHDGAGLGIVEVVVIGGRGKSAQITIIDTGGGHGVTVRGVGCPAGAGGRVR